MKKRNLAVAMALVLALTMVPSQVFAAGKSAAVTLPSFKVTFNGVTVDNNYSKYPLIVYNNITYFPMTYSDCRFLGVESTWKGNKEGLLIDATGVTAAYSPYQSGSKNGRSYTATIPQFPIKVNGKTVNNSKEEYPLLSFRDITYFPMTWRWGVDEFNWKYSFDNKAGLVIQSDNIRLTQTGKLSDIVSRDGLNSGKNAAIGGGKVYYTATKGRILQAPLSDVSKVKKVYDLPIWSYGDGKQYVSADLENLSGQMMLNYHQGGATMGSDWKIMLGSDGSTKEIQNSYWTTTAIGDRLFSYYAGPMPSAGMLEMGTGTEDGVRIGQKDYWYTGLKGGDYTGPALLVAGKLVLQGDNLYLVAAKEVGSEGSSQKDPYYLCKVNLKTNQVTKVSREATSMAQVDDQYAYYLSAGNIYRISLKDGQETLLAKIPNLASDWDATFVGAGGAVYFTEYNDGKLYWSGKAGAINPGGKVDSMDITGDNGEYVVCTFEETPEAQYRLMVFDHSGNTVFKTSDKAHSGNVTIEGKTIYYYNKDLKTVCMGTLK